MQSTSGLTGYSACRTGLGHNEGISVAHLRTMLSLGYACPIHVTLLLFLIVVIALFVVVIIIVLLLLMYY